MKVLWGSSGRPELVRALLAEASGRQALGLASAETNGVRSGFTPLHFATGVVECCNHAKESYVPGRAARDRERDRALGPRPAKTPTCSRAACSRSGFVFLQIYAPHSAQHSLLPGGGRAPSCTARRVSSRHTAPARTRGAACGL